MGIEVAEGCNVVPRGPGTTETGSPTPSEMETETKKGLDREEVAEGEPVGFEAAVPGKDHPYFVVATMLFVVVVLVGLAAYWRIDFETDPSKAIHAISMPFQCHFNIHS